MNPLTNWSGLQDRTAPWYGVPSHRLVSVEHPCIVKNPDNAIASLQGGPAISKLLTSTRGDTPATLSLNPQDPMSRTILSHNKPANNVLLKVSVPKRTGRKRKRGSQEPFTDGTAPDTGKQDESGSRGLNAKQLLRRLQDNADRYHVEAVGLVERTHVFRGMPDFVYSTAASPFVNKFRENILPFEYPKMKEFHLDMTKGSSSTADIIPPPSLSTFDVPFNYFYRQNSAVKQLIDPSGQLTTVNTQQADRILTHLCPYDVPAVPTKPMDECPPISSLDQSLQDMIAALRPRFEERPAWTRRALRNTLPPHFQQYQVRMAIPYLAYHFRSGPWRDANIRLGYDPRSDPEARFYQTLNFRLHPQDGGAGGPAAAAAADEDQLPDTATTTLSGSSTLRRPPNTTAGPAPRKRSSRNSHIFTGDPPLYRDGKTWMVCDITDPLLTESIFSEPPRAECAIGSSGWYGNVEIATARAIMRAKMQYMMDLEQENDAAAAAAAAGGEDNVDTNTGNAEMEPYPYNEDLRPLLRLPRHVDTEEEMSRLSVTDNSRCIVWAAEIRNTVRSQTGKKGRSCRLGGDEAGRKKVKWADREQQEQGQEPEEEEEDDDGEDEGEGDSDEQEEPDEGGEDDDDMEVDDDDDDAAAAA